MNRAARPRAKEAPIPTLGWFCRSYPHAKVGFSLRASIYGSFIVVEQIDFFWQGSFHEVSLALYLPAGLCWRFLGGPCLGG